MRIRLGSPRIMSFWLLFLLIQAGTTFERMHRNRLQHRLGMVHAEEAILAFFGVVIVLYIAMMLRNHIDFTPTALTLHRALMPTRTIPYADITTVRTTAINYSGDDLYRVLLESSNTTLSDSPRKLLSIQLKDPDLFLETLRTYAPAATFEAPASSVTRMLPL